VDRAALGKAARKEASRSRHAEWEPPSNRADPVEVLEQQAADRVPELLPLRYGRMLASPFAFFRGAATIMAADLAATPVSGLWVQACGDAHLSNFGAYAAPDRDMVVDVNDFDETLPAPWEWDLKRLATSFEIAGRDRAFDCLRRHQIVLTVAAEYRRTMRELAGLGHLDVWYRRVDVSEIRKEFRQQMKRTELEAADRNLAKARKKDRMRAFSKLTHRVNGEPRIVSDPPVLVPLEEMFSGRELDEAEGAVHRLVEDYRDTLREEHRHLLNGYRYVHAARKVVGVGSVGQRAWIALLLGRDDADPLFLQVKEAGPSVLEPHTAPTEFPHQGQRVVVGQRLTQAATDILLGWLSAEGPDGVWRDFYVRQLWDQKGSAPIEQMSPKMMEVYARVCGGTLARGHARSGDRVAIAAYLGSRDTFDLAIAGFAGAYADQNERDYAAVRQGIQDGRLVADLELA
jgi:uncharacterized protein (DUF2252 family)